MKFIRIIICVLVLLSICGCSDKSKSVTYPDYPVIESPDKLMQETIDGYRSVPTDSDEDTETIYYANKESKKIHLPTCHYALKMAETKIRIEQDKEVLYLEGYTDCGVCKP
ncbi:MAG: hypothetical protein U0M42_00305 [Acutalibacteraceae bacterium]|nr:hypothetical protein [Acutalibacteraceae bacterium]